MTPQQFQQLANEGYNRIPVTHEVLADLDTPVSAYLKLANGAYSCLLESVQGGERWGRYSFICLPAKQIIRISGSHIQVLQQGDIVEELDHNAPLDWIRDFQQRFRVPILPGLPRFNGGLVGYFGYDTIRYIEPRLATVEKPDPLGTPDILLMVSDEMLAFDNLNSCLYLIVHADPAQPEALAKAEQRLKELITRLREPLPQPLTPVSSSLEAVHEQDFISGFSQSGYEQAVDRCKQYIVDGDVMQVVLSQRMSITCDLPPLNVYRALRGLNPSPYMYFLNLDDFHIVGSSPEILVRLEGKQVTVRPIAGTRPRGENEGMDKVLEEELLADTKERAEHLMLIDLGRNDVGHVAQTGTVQVTENMLVERYSHVMHIVSNVNGTLKPGLDAIDVLQATFPAGTLSGAPKIRAMEIIDEFEPVKRGIYSGAIGYLAWHGDMDTAIAIRTAVIKDGQLHIQAGAGIVTDSVPSDEWQETLNKGRAIFRAVAMASNGLM